MADSALDQLENYPAWQLALGWVLGAGLVLGGWYFLYFGEALDDRTKAQGAVTVAEANLAKAKDNLANYEQRVKEQAERDKELKKTLDGLSEKERKAFIEKAKKRHAELASKFVTVVQEFPEDKQPRIRDLVATLTR